MSQLYSWKKKILVGFLISFLLVISVTLSCGAQKKITVWLYPDESDAVNYPQIISEFEKEYPDIRIDAQMVPWEGHVEKYTTAIAAGTTPDVGYTYPSLYKQWAVYGKLYPLDEFLGGKLAKDNLALANAYTYKGKLHAMPFIGDCRPLFYNKDMFTKAGVEFPSKKKPISIERFLEISKKLTKDFDGDGQIDQYAWAWAGVPTASGADNVWPIFWAAGADMIIEEENRFGFNTPEGKEALQFIVDFERKYKLSPSGVVGMRLDEIATLFTGQRTAMYNTSGGSFLVSLRDFPELDYGTGLMPKWRSKYCTYGVMDALVIFSSTKYPEAAWKWIKFLMQDKYAKRISRVMGQASGRIDIGNVTEARNPAEEEVLEVMKRQWNWARIHDTHPAVQELFEITLSQIGAARLGQKSVEKALADAEKKANEVLKEYEE